MRSEQYSPISVIARLRSYLDDWEHVLRQEGFAKAFPAIRRELARLLFRRKKFIVVACSLLNPLPDHTPDIDVEIREFKDSDLDLIKNIDRPSEVKLYQKRVEQNHLGVIAFHHGKPVGYAWAHSRMDANTERIHWRLEPGDMICLEAFTVPTYRCRGIMTALALARFRIFQAQGFQRAVTYIEKNNHASLAVWRNKLGSRIIGQINYFRFGPWRRIKHIKKTQKKDFPEDDPPPDKWKKTTAA